MEDLRDIRRIFRRVVEEVYLIIYPGGIVLRGIMKDDF